MDKISVFHSDVSGEFPLHPSKSFLLRFLFCALLSGEECVTDADNLSSDVLSGMDTVARLGAKTEYKDGKLTVMPGTFINRPDVRCGLSASVLRFAAPLLFFTSGGTLNADFSFDGRNLSDVSDFVNTYGGSANYGFPLKITGKPDTFVFSFDSPASSQLISGIMMSSVLLENDVTVYLKNAVSLPYIKLTARVMELFGVKTEIRDDRIFIPKNGGYKKYNGTSLPDMSSAAVLLTLGALCGKTETEYSDDLPLLPDGEIINILKSFGAKVTSDKKLTAEKGKFLPLHLSIKDTPDLFPLVCIMASVSDGVSEIRDTLRLKNKECDRVFAVAENLKKAGIQTEEKDGTFYIYGGNPKPAVFSSFGDHRIFTAFTLLSAYLKNESIIDDPDCVKKSYPSFLSDFKNIGGRYSDVRI